MPAAIRILERKSKMKFYMEDAQRVLEQVGSAPHGLGSEEAAARLEKNGKNKLAEGKKISIFRRFLNQLADPMLIILMVAAVISGITSAYSGEGFTDVIIIGVVVLINAILGVYQESKAEQAIAALQEMAAATSKVLRNGQMQTIKSEDLVVGDVVILEAGDAVPADGRIIECASLKIEEAALTGESVPVTKALATLGLADGQKDITLGDRTNMVYMGSTVVYGRGRAVITATGMDTEMGKIATALSQAEDEQTPLQKKLGQLSKTLSWLVLAICAFIFVVSVWRAGSFDPGTLLSTFMVAVSLAVAAIPEGLATVVTIVLSIGVTRMSKRNAVIRKLTAVETLGCTQIICSDKTGTLTQNKMTVVQHFAEDEKLLASAMALCSDAELEPTEAALVAYAAALGLKKSQLKEEQPRVGEAPFDSVRKMMSTVHQQADGSYLQYTKGAPDEVIQRCDSYLKGGKVLPMTREAEQEILSANRGMTQDALRVLGAAIRRHDKRPQSFEAAELEQGMTFLGLAGMIDPIRPEVVDAIEECKQAGIRAVMITGDHKDTAVAIAKQLGILENESQAITGAQLSEISDEDFESTVEKYRVYARVQPEHKVRIVKAWRAKGYITAMTGDGVNDAPSIKSADIGVGMGITGTDVTKNVADMVLADDNFATIVNAVEEGRRIYDNIKKSIQFLLASNMSEVLCIFFATMMGFTILKPVHLLWINLMTDTFPALALGMEKGEPDLMRKPPRNSREGIFAGGMGFDVAYQGIFVTIITMAAYFIGHFMEAGVWEIAESADGMTMAFLTMSMAEIFHSFNMRSQRKSVFALKGHNRYLWGAMIISLLLTVAVIYVPFLARAFEFEHISLAEYAVSMALAISVLPMVELVKFFQRCAARRKAK